MVTLSIGANRAKVVFGEVAASRASVDGSRRLLERANQRLELVRLSEEQVERNPLR
jgi:hypothetical protein